MSEKLAKIAYLSIGSNLGNKKKNIELIKFKLQDKYTMIIKSSRNYQSISWPDKKKPNFINAVLKIKTLLSPQDLIIKCLNIETQLGRIRNKKNEPRICDIDIIDYDKRVLKISKKPKLTLPHTQMHKRNFVLLPLFEITKTWIHPIMKISVQDLINSLKTQDLRTIKLI